MKFVLVLFLLFYLPNDLIAKTPPVILNDGVSFYGIGLNLDILEDKESKLTIEDINRPEWASQFKRNKVKNPNFGLSKSTFWARFKVKNKSKKVRQWIVTNSYGLQDNITFYRKKKGAWSSKKTGDLFNFKTREILENGFSFYLNGDQNEFYFIKIKGAINKLNLSIASETKFKEESRKQFGVMSIFSGIILALFFYNILLCVSVRSKTYLVYCIYVLSYGLTQVVTSGYASTTIFANLPWFNNSGVAFFVGNVLWSFLIFSRDFLDLKSANKIIKKLIQILIFLSLALIIVSISLPYRFSAGFIFVMAIIAPFSILFIAILRAREGFRPAKYFVIAFSLALIGVMIFALSHLKVLPVNNLTQYSFMIGNTLELILLSFALGDKYNLIQEESIKIQENYSKDLEKQVDEKTKDLAEEKENVSNLLHNVNEAIFTIGIDCAVKDKAISKFSSELFEGSISGKNVCEILYPHISKDSEDYGIIMFAIKTTLMNDAFQWELNRPYIPLKSSIQTSKGKRSLKIRPDIIFATDKETCEEILFCVEDITEREALKEEIKKQQALDDKRNMIIYELAPNQGVDPQVHRENLKNFFIDSKKLLSKNFKLCTNSKESVSKNELDEIWRNIHTIKGNSRVYDLRGLSSSIHSEESNLNKIYEKQIESIDKNDFDFIVECMIRVKEKFSEYQVMASDIFGIRLSESETMISLRPSDLKDFGSILDKAKDTKSIKQEWGNLFKISILSELNGFKDLVYKTAKDLGKLIEFQVFGDDIKIEKDKLSIVSDAIIHLLRNSIDHGIEDPDRRKDNGKNEKGSIISNCKANDQFYTISIRDDGKGINSETISSIALKKGFISKAELSKLTEQQRLMLIFKPGFSSIDEATEISGRGIGMDVVKTNIEKLNGSIELNSEEGKGSEFIIKIPV